MSTISYYKALQLGLDATSDLSEPDKAWQSLHDAFSFPRTLTSRPDTKDTLGLWMHVMQVEAHIALSDLVEQVSFMPRAVQFWKHRQKRQARYYLEQGPWEWIRPTSTKIRLEEVLASLQDTLAAHLVKIGKLKHLLERFESDEDVQVDEALALLADVFSTRGIRTPRRGKGAFQVAESLPCEPISFDAKPTEDSVQSMDALGRHLETFDASRKQFRACLETAMNPCRPPSKIRQRWLHVTVVVAGVSFGAYYLFQHRKEMKEMIVTTYSSVGDFFQEHMVEPLTAITKEVLLNEKSGIQDQASLEDSNESLRRMLEDFMRDKQPQLSPDQKQEVLQNMDMSVVSLHYEKQLSHAVRNLLTGDIVRMLLIQVQFIKKELMTAMGAIDELMLANQVNLQLLATIPTFVVVGGCYRVFREVLRQVYKRFSERIYYDPKEVATYIRHQLRDVERLLNRQDWVGRLDDHDLGFLLLLLHQLKEAAMSQQFFVERGDKERLMEDLEDLVEKGVGVNQQLAVVQRMHRTHVFLSVTQVNVSRLL